MKSMTDQTDVSSPRRSPARGTAHSMNATPARAGRRVALFATFLLVLCALCATTPAAENDGPRPRIISLYAAHTEVLLRLGARDNIIGVSRQETYDGPEAEGWDPAEFSFRDDVETFLVAKPDLVLVRPQHVAAGGRLKEALERAGIRVVSMQVTRAEDLYGYWRELGSLVGRSAEAERMIADFEAGLAPYRNAAAKMPHKPGVFVEAIHREVKTFTPDSLPIWLVELAGGRNVAADAEAATPGVIIASYGPEMLLAKAKEVDILISQEGAMNRVPLAQVRERDIYQPLAAVKAGRVYKMPEALLARPTPSLLEGLRMIAAWTGIEAYMNAADSGAAE